MHGLGMDGFRNSGQPVAWVPRAEGACGTPGQVQAGSWTWPMFLSASPACTAANFRFSRIQDHTKALGKRGAEGWLCSIVPSRGAPPPLPCGTLAKLVGHQWFIEEHDTHLSICSASGILLPSLEYPVRL